MEQLKELNTAYRRFKHYFEAFNGVYIYPEYQKDLKVMMAYIDNELIDLEDILYEQIPNAMV